MEYASSAIRAQREQGNAQGWRAQMHAPERSFALTQSIQAQQHQQSFYEPDQLEEASQQRSTQASHSFITPASRPTASVVPPLPVKLR
jgi:hypothetical protein